MRDRKVWSFRIPFGACVGTGLELSTVRRVRGKRVEIGEWCWVLGVVGDFNPLFESLSAQGGDASLAKGREDLVRMIAICGCRWGCETAYSGALVAGRRYLLRASEADQVAAAVLPLSGSPSPGERALSALGVGG